MFFKSSNLGEKNGCCGSIGLGMVCSESTIKCLQLI